MTEQEQAVTERLIAFVDEAAAVDESIEPADRTMRAIEALELSPEECTADVLRALWEISSEFYGTRRSQGWITTSGVWAAVVTRMHRHYTLIAEKDRAGS